jgi:hypothetical protein
MLFYSLPFMVYTHKYQLKVWHGTVVTVIWQHRLF